MNGIGSPVFVFWAIATFILVFLCSFAFTRPWFPLFRLDVPNKRSLHTKPVPRGSGLVIWLIVLTLYLISKEFLGLEFLINGRVVIGSVFLLFISTLDDYRSIPVWLRLVIQCLVAVILVWNMGVFPSELLPGVTVQLPVWVETFIAIVLVVWISNLFNFMDGLDGLVGGAAVIGFGFIGAVSAMVGLIPLTMFCVIIVGGYLGFLVWNLPPAKLFMGDAGSIPLGFVVAAVILISARQGGLPFWAGIGIFAPLFADATVTLLRRLLTGARIWEAHREHYYQRLVLAGYSVRLVLIFYLVLSAVCGAISLAVFRASASVAWGGIVFIMALLVTFGILIERKIRLLKQAGTGRPCDFVPFHFPSIGDEEVRSVEESMRSGWITSGPKVKEFEKSFSAKVGGAHGVAVNSATAALHLALEAIGLKAGDEVIIPTMTFATSAEVVLYFGAKPVLVDIEPDTMNMDPAKVEEAITQRTKAIMPVHFAGHPCEMDRIMAIAHAHKLLVIEDAAHSFPAEYKGKAIGTIGDITCFSFYATKTITTGEGGMSVTNNADWAERMRIMSLHGISKDAWKRYTAEGSWYYEIISPGFKYNMTDIAAAMGIEQLKKADLFLKQRKQIAERYTKELSRIKGLKCPIERPGVEGAWHLYVIRLELGDMKFGRDEFIERLKKMGIGTGVHFIPLHIHPYYREHYGYKPEDFPVAWDLYQRVISLPLFPGMTDGDVERVIKVVSDTAREKAG